MTDLDQRIVDRLFENLKAIFPKWREIWQTDGELAAAKKQWTRTIVKQGLADPRMIKLGIEKAEMIGWVRPPSPAQFCQWCMEAAKEQAGIPTKEQAVAQIMEIAKISDYARKRSPMSPAIYQSCRFIDWYDFRKPGMTIEKAEKAVERAYDQMVDHWMQGRPFAEQPVAIERQNPSGVKLTKASREEAKERIRKLRESLK